MTGVPRRIRSTDDVTLALYESGDPAAPTLVAVHGYPNDHTVWDGVVELLAARFHVVTYDVRGAGASDRPGARSAYRVEQLVADLGAVLDAVSPDRPVHLLGHDWGSVQLWPALTEPGLAGRIASFTSISGPGLAHVAAWARGVLRHPRAGLRQLARSWYVGAFQLPYLPELGIRAGVVDRSVRRSGRAWRSSLADPAPPVAGRADQLGGLQLYRANLLAGARGRPQRTDVPVQIVVPERDEFVTPDLALDAARPFVAELTERRIAGGHWVVSERPDVIARLVGEFVDALDGGAPPRRDRPATRGRFAGRLALVTGGARGIGRATAVQFARCGADVLIADVDDAAAKETVAQLSALGVRAWAEHLDVGDVEQWEAFAVRVREHYRVPDIVVNNAGIGMGGPFLRTSAADWGRIVNVNQWSVIHGSRLFAAMLVERGEGGHLVNIASAAAYSPSVAYPAYATTKAAVLMLTECLRAELHREGIAVTAVCPGFIDTDISRTTVHVGVDDATAARLRDEQVASYRRRNYAPERVAAQLVDAVAAGRPLAIVTPEAKAMRAVNRLAPALGRRIARVDLAALGH